MTEAMYAEMMRLQGQLVDTCSECGGAGYLSPVNPGEVNPCKCMTVHSYLCRLIEAEIPKDYWWLTIDELEVDEDYLSLVRWFSLRLVKAVSNGMGILFMGENGIGKTSMQCAIGKEAIVQGMTVKYYTAQQYIEAKKSKNDEWIVDAESAQVILLDELDKVYISKGSDFVKKTLEEYLRRMTSEGKCMVICTNGDSDYLKKTFGDSTMSALSRHLRFLGVSGEDYGEKLQARWMKIMGDERDWYDEAIFDMAKRRMAREQEEDRREWEKVSRR